jgi:hypothetical protein
MSEIHPKSFIDLARYPVDALESDACAALVARCRGEIAKNAYCLLDGFLTEAAVGRFWDESMSLSGRSNRRDSVRSAYLDTPDREDGSLPEGHARRRFFHTSWGVIADDLIPAEHGLRQLYEWGGLTEFVGRVLDVDPLYRHADRFQALNINVLKPGDTQAWHFDDMDFVVLLYLTTPQAGGALECAAHIRTDDDPNYAGVAQAFDGTWPGLRRVFPTAGTLAVMRGHHSVHRVLPVEGRTPRLTAVLAYDRVPDKREGDAINIAIFGERIRPLLEAGFNKPKG